MKRRFSVVLMLVVALMAVSVAPVGAKHGATRVLRGHMDLDFNRGLVIGGGAAPDVSWVGTVEFGDAMYPIVFFPTAPLEERGRLVLFEEDWKIYDSLTYTYEDGVLTSFDPGPIILEGHERGVVFPNGRALSFGAITEANSDSRGHLEDVSVGDRVFWYGRFLDETQMEFAGPFRIFLSGLGPLANAR